MMDKNMDTLVKGCTSFKNWADMKASLDTGYIPSLLGKGKDEGTLARMIRARGYRVYRNGRVD
jgi:hypothetical protein